MMDKTENKQMNKKSYFNKNTSIMVRVRMMVFSQMFI